MAIPCHEPVNEGSTMTQSRRLQKGGKPTIPSHGPKQGRESLVAHINPAGCVHKMHRFHAGRFRDLGGLISPSRVLTRHKTDRSARHPRFDPRLGPKAERTFTVVYKNRSRHELPKPFMSLPRPAKHYTLSPAHGPRQTFGTTQTGLNRLWTGWTKWTKNFAAVETGAHIVGNPAIACPACPAGDPG